MKISGYPFNYKIIPVTDYHCKPTAKKLSNRSFFTKPENYWPILCCINLEYPKSVSFKCLNWKEINELKKVTPAETICVLQHCKGTWEGVFYALHSGK